MGRGNAKRRGALPSWSISTRSPIEPCQALRAQQIFLSRVSWGVGVAHSHESLIDGRREVRGQKVGSCLQSHVFHHLPDGKFSRAFNSMFSIISLTESSLVAMARSSVFREFGTLMLLLVLCLSYSFHSSGGINQHVAVAQFVYEEQGCGACVAFTERVVLGRNAINFQSAARKISKMFAARKKIITFASVKPWGPYRGSHRQSK